MSDANVEKLFPGRPNARPTIYAYAETRSELVGLLKVGYDDEAYQKDEAGNALDETYLEIDAKYYLQSRRIQFCELPHRRG